MLMMGYVCGLWHAGKLVEMVSVLSLGHHYLCTPTFHDHQLTRSSQ